jgi:hypothetical protein
MGGRLTEQQRAKERVQVLVSESPPPSGDSLRSILEERGFDIVGVASTPEELRHFLTWTDPHVVVFDAETSVTTVEETRASAPQAGLVVVWPAGVTASSADLRVEPWRAEFDLPKAVRAARVRHAPPVKLAIVTELEPATILPDGDVVVDEAAAAALMGADTELAPDALARKRANLALLFAAASFALLVLIFSAQLAERRLAPTHGVAAPVTLVPTPSNTATGGIDTGSLLKNPAPFAVQPAVLLSQSISGGISVQPPQGPGTGSSGSTGSNAPPSGSQPSGVAVRAHQGGPANGGPGPIGRHGNGGGGGANGGGGGANGGGGGANGGGGGANGGGGGANGQSGQTHGQSGQTHGQSGQTHGQSGQTHGQSGQTHGQSGKSHGNGHGAS